MLTTTDQITRYAAPFEPFSAQKAAGSLQRGTWLRQVLLAARPGDVIDLPPGRYDVGSQYNLPIPGITLRGVGGKERVEIVCGFANNIGPGAAFELADGAVLDGLTLTNNCRPWDQGVLVGFGQTGGDTPQNSNRTATVRNCQLNAVGFALYNWSGDKNKLIAENNTGQCGRWAVYNGRSSGPDCCETILRRNVFTIDARLCLHQGEQGNNLVAIGARGGKVSDIGSEYILIASGPLPYLNADGTPLLHSDPALANFGKPVEDWPGTPAVQALWIDPDGKGLVPEAAVIEARDVHVRVIAPAGVPVDYKVPTIGTINTFGGSFQ